LPAEQARVLLVDDDDKNLLAVATVLEDLGEMVLARSGEEALRHLLKSEFAVILLDVFMPGMDGYETAQIIRGREQTKRIPIIFLSAVNKEAEHLWRGYSMGAVDYVFKPVDPLILRSKVAVFVDLFEKSREIERKARQEQALLDANLAANAERLRAEQELRRLEQRQAVIIQSLPMVLYLEPHDAHPRVPPISAAISRRSPASATRRSPNSPASGPSGSIRTTGSECLRPSTQDEKRGVFRSNIGGSAPTGTTGISSTRRCCSRTPRGAPSSSPAR